MTRAFTIWKIRSLILIYYDLRDKRRCGAITSTSTLDGDLVSTTEQSNFPNHANSKASPSILGAAVLAVPSRQVVGPDPSESAVKVAYISAAATRSCSQTAARKNS